MPSAGAGDPFASESAWPFRLNQRELDRCREFLTQPGDAPRVLRVFGPSGAGKSFLVRELMTQLSTGAKNEVGLYVDVPPGDLEACTWLDRLAALLSAHGVASRDAPSFVGRKVAKAWSSASHDGPGKGVTYGYQASRELTAQIPVVGPLVKGLMPQAVPARSSVGDAAPLRFLVRRSGTHRVVLAIDNVQFMPFALRELLDAELGAAGVFLRLVLIERTRGGRRFDWRPPIPRAEVVDIDIGKASAEEVAAVIAEVMPDAAGDDELAASVFRRSDGNLKSVWFQLRLIALRRSDQVTSSTSYEDVILTLAPLDQAVLRLVVFTIGGLTVATLVSLLQATNLYTRPDSVTAAIGDLASLGLLVVNGDRADRVRVEHELVAQVVSEITPEEDKLDLRSQVVTALSSLLDAGEASPDEAVLYDRFLGIVNDAELRQEPSLMSHVVRYVQLQSEFDRHRYLASICKDSVCWDVLDVLPDTTVRSLLDAIQKSSLFSFGLVATSRLRNGPGRHESLASLYEAKYLVQLFQYDEARKALDRVEESKEKRAVAFNIMLNLCQDEEAAQVAMGVFSEVSTATGTEQDYVILRNSGHLFPSEDARAVVDAAVEGFKLLGRPFGFASAMNNRGVLELADGELATARSTFESARDLLAEIDSIEVYQPLVNLSAVALVEGDLAAARRWLSEARHAAPRSLLQDSAMLDHNDVVLHVCDGRCTSAEAVNRTHEVVKVARRTHDLRFRDLANWLAELVAAAHQCAEPPTSSLAQRIEEIRTNGRVPMEIFAPARLGDVELEVPFVLSPNWRY